MTKEEILNGMSEEEFYNLYPTEEAYFMAKGGSLSGAPHNGQPTADEFFSYGAPALGHMNIPMSNPTYLADGGTYFGGPIRPYAYGGLTYSKKFGELDKAEFGKQKSFDDLTNTRVNTIANTITYPQRNTAGVYQPDKPWIVKPMTAGPGSLTGIPAKPTFEPKYGTGVSEQDQLAAFMKQNPVKKYGGFQDNSVTEYCWGGLPGGANEMPEMLKGGYNSPTNYGSFSVPMAEGGYYQTGGSNDLVDWAAKQQQMLQQRTNVGVPANVKKYFGAFDEPGKFDSTHVYPGDPNIAMGFKGNKVMLTSKDGDAENTVRRVNKPRTFVGPTVKGERDVYFDYLAPHEYGGILDASNNQDFPMMEEGGRANLMKIIKAASKKMKKEYADGGNTTMQGGNQDYLTNMKDTYDNFLKQKVYNSLVDQEQQDLSKAFMRMGGIPMAAGGWDLSPEYKNSERRSQVIKALENKKRIAINQDLSDDQLLDMARKEGIIVDTADNQSQNTAQNTPSIASMFKQLAQDFGPESRTQGYSNFPANFRSYWQMNKAGRESINSLPDNFQLGNLKGSPEYGALGRTWLGKKMGIGPKRINFELSGTSQYKNTPYKQGPQVQLADPNNPLFKPYSQVSTGAPEGTLQTNKGSFAPLDFHIGKQQGPMAYGGLYKAQSGVGTPISMGQGVALKGTAPGGTSLDSLYSLPVASSISTPANVEQMKKQAGREPEQLYKTEIQGDTGTTNVSAKGAFERDNSGLLNAVGQYAVPGINTLAGMIEAPGQQRRQKQAMLNAMTPGSDTGPFAVKPTNAMNRGDYDPNTGMFRPNAMVPVQFPGGSYGAYGGSFQDGGMFEEGEELDLSPEQMEYLRSQGYDFDILEDID